MPLFSLDIKLDTVPYNEDNTVITWEECTLRAWLNGEFLNKTFSAKEQSAILITLVDNSANQGYSEWNTVDGKNTQDKIFLLSYAEANRYLGVTTVNNSNNTKSRVAPTAYAITMGAFKNNDYKTVDGEPAGSWWLRTPDGTQSVACVRVSGSLGRVYASNDTRVVRPAFWLNLDSDIF